MKEDLYVSIFAIFISLTTNLIGGVINDILGYYPGSKQLFSSLILSILFGLLYYVSSQINIKIKKTLRLPLIRTLFWIVIAFPLLTQNILPIHHADLIDAFIPEFCFFASAIAQHISEYTWLSKINFGVWGVYIFGVSLYQIFVLEISSRIVNIIKT